MKHIEYVTSKGNKYRIVYRMCGLCNWEWDILLYSPAPGKSDWLGLAFNWERALFPKRVMTKILRHYAEDKDGANLN